MAELKPCPFCGHEPIIGRHYTGMRKADYRIECKWCLIRQVWYRRLKDAAEAWNRRFDNGD